MGVMASRALKEREKANEPQPINNVTAQRADPVLADIVEWS